MEMKRLTHWLPGKRIKQIDASKRQVEIRAHLPRYWQAENLSAPAGQWVNLALQAARLLLQKQISEKQFSISLQEVNLQNKSQTKDRVILAKCELDPVAFVAVKQELLEELSATVRLKVQITDQKGNLLAQARTQWLVCEHKASRVDQ
jgi:hypothetical protein